MRALAKKMTISSKQLVLTDSETLDEVLKCLAENFSIETQGAYDQQSLFEIFSKLPLLLIFPPQCIQLLVIPSDCNTFRSRALWTWDTLARGRSVDCQINSHQSSILSYFSFWLGISESAYE
ncbi:hypothetical protein NIES3974_09590 [Calothrix sp. NIES-3974]|nr:hypothetical protein [Calothrix sp. NIES-3974]BAZ04326.1 hypothetical protein NIES3974_09590 [Calothrix sp. NIES-3974]